MVPLSDDGMIGKRRPIILKLRIGDVAPNRQQEISIARCLSQLEGQYSGANCSFGHCAKPNLSRSFVCQIQRSCRAVPKVCKKKKSHVPSPVLSLKLSSLPILSLMRNPTPALAPSPVTVVDYSQTHESHFLSRSLPPASLSPDDKSAHVKISKSLSLALSSSSNLIQPNSLSLRLSPSQP